MGQPLSGPLPGECGFERGSQQQRYLVFLKDPAHRRNEGRAGAVLFRSLVNLFGAVPLVTSTDYAKTDQLGRSSEDSVYALILADLTDAQQNLTVNYPSSGHVRPNLYTVKTFLSKVYLYRKQWQQAYNAADTVINSGLYSLEPDPEQCFS